MGAGSNWQLAIESAFRPTIAIDSQQKNIAADFR
jgi:hypothetical protein